ncbi:MAG: glycyl radical protein [Oscillospiraceae bacterium]
MNIDEKAKKRISTLREKMLVQPSVCVERAYYRTLSYKETEGQCPPIRRARAFEKILNNMTVRIDDGELIVGKITSKDRGGSISPELQADWILNELDILSTRDIDPFQPLTDPERQTLKEIVPYWYGKCLRDIWNERVPEETKKYDDILVCGGAYCGNNQYYGHASPDYATILNLGAEAMIGNIERRMSELSGASNEQSEQLLELEAMKICLKSVISLADRYAQLALEMAQSETDSARRSELLAISQNCRNVPRKSASSFYEALQSLWFAYMGVEIENWGTGNTFLRADQYLYPFYKKDLESGKLTREKACELIALLLIKCNEFCVVYSEQRSHGFAGNTSGTSFTLGGVTPDGKCAVNQLSYIFLEAEQFVNLSSEDLVVRVDDSTPDDFLMLACTVARDASGKLKFIGDDTAIKQMLFDDRPLSMARDYAVVGCTSPTVAGKSYDIPGGIIGLPKILELALNNGVCRITGRRLGPETGDSREFKSYDELWAAFCRQAEAVIPQCHIIKNTDKEVFAEYAPSPFLSSMYDICVERGLDVVRGGTRPHLSFAMSLAGAPNVGDSLAAIKKYVFEEKKISMAQLIEALEANFEGFEDMRSLLLRAPRFGNNDAYVDSIVNEVLSFTSDLLSKTPGYAGARTTAAAAAVTANVALGMFLGATPDGRKAGEPISEGGISPYQGRNVSGPTATMLSVAGLDHLKLRHGEVLNMRFDPKSLAGQDKLAKFAAMIRSYFKAGGFLVQFNIVDTETLRDAQAHPERHRDLVVRVATYAAYFIEIGRDLQNDIINRLEFGEIS